MLSQSFGLGISIARSNGFAADRPLYLCGGGALASAMLAEGLIDEVVLKRAPILLGAGTPLWSGAPTASRLLEHRDYPGGLSLQRYALG